MSYSLPRLCLCLLTLGVTLACVGTPQAGEIEKDGQTQIEKNSEAYIYWKIRFKQAYEPDGAHNDLYNLFLYLSY